MTASSPMFDVKITQAQFAALVGISPPAVSHLLKSGSLGKGGTAADWILAYCEMTRANAYDQPAGLTEERARLAKAQADKVEMQNAVTRGELAPKSLLTVALASLTARVVGLLETIPVELRRMNPKLTPEDVAVAQRVIDKVRNAAAATTLDGPELTEEPAE